MGGTVVKGIVYGMVIIESIDDGLFLLPMSILKYFDSFCEN